MLRSILLGTSALTVAALAAAWLTVARGAIVEDATRVRGAARIAVVAVLCQAAHFAEELATGFQQRFPELLGLAPWSTTFFVTFNLAWLVVWSASVRGLEAHYRLALLPLWFLGIASVANGIAHPILSLRVAGYFPGLFTSPLVGLTGILLLRRLGAITPGRAHDDSPARMPV